MTGLFVEFYRFVGGVTLLFIMALTVTDVFGRYLLDMPLRGSYDLIQMAMATLIFWFLPLLSLTGGHVTVTLIPMGRGRLTRIRVVLIELTCASVAAVLAWRLWEVGNDAARFGETTLLLRLPTAPVTWLCAAFAALTAIAHLVNAARPSALAGRSAGTPGAGH